MKRANHPVAPPPAPANDRQFALQMAISSMEPSGNEGVERILLNRAQKFANWLAGEADTQP